MKNMMSFIISFGLHPVSPTWVSLQSKRETRSLKGQTRPPFSMAPGDLSTYPHTTASSPYNNHTYPLPEIGKNKYIPTLYSTEKLYINKPSKHKIPYQYHIPISPPNPVTVPESSYPPHIIPPSCSVKIRQNPH